MTDTVSTQAGPFAVIPVWVLGVGLNGSELAVYVSLRSFANQQGQARPYVKTIAERAGVSERTAEKAIARLRELDLITSTRRYREDGSIAGCDYWLRDVAPGPVQSDATPPVQSDTTPPSNRTEHELTNELTNPNNPQLSLVRPKPEKPDPLEGFDDFWKWYPKKVDKIAAKKAWPKAVKAAGSIQLIQRGAWFYAKACHGKDPQYVKNPASWLNAGSWDNAPTTTTKAPARSHRSSWIASVT